MVSEQAQKEMLEFHAFVGRRLADGAGSLSPEEVVKEFRAYQLEEECPSEKR